MIDPLLYIGYSFNRFTAIHRLYMLTDQQLLIGYICTRYVSKSTHPSSASNSCWGGREAKSRVQSEAWLSCQEATRSIQRRSERIKGAGSRAKRVTWSIKDVQVDTRRRWNSLSAVFVVVVVLCVCLSVWVVRSLKVLEKSMNFVSQNLSQPWSKTALLA